MSKWSYSVVALGLFWMMGAAGCADSVKTGGNDQDVIDAQGDGLIVDGADGVSSDVKKDTITDGTGTTSWVRPAGTAALRITIDDSANGTYEGGQMKWTGSFSWSAVDNTISFATSWLPTDGPYPSLYDDGPMSAGGHEPDDAVAGDHLFQAEVWFTAEADTSFEYGVLNEFDRWIWIGPNGMMDVPAGSTDTFTCAGLTLPAFGNVDLKVTLDMAALQENFVTITPDSYGIYLKSSANSWTPVQLIDNGQNGDDVASDGVFTYLQSKGIGLHDGLLYDGQHTQFVFVFAQEGVNPDDGLEYKVTTQCATEGIKAYTDVAAPGTMVEATIEMERDSRGRVFNTTVIVGGGNPWCEVTDDCFGSLPCEDEQCIADGDTSHPTIVLIDPAKGPPAGGTDVTITGTDFREGATVKFGDLAAATVTWVSATQLTVVTPAHTEGKVNVVVRNPDEGSAAYPNGFEFVEPVEPNRLDWGQLNDPLSVTTRMGCIAGPFFAQAYEAGVTSSIDNASLIKAQFGYGPSASDPSTAETWTWADVAYPGYPIVSGNNMVFAATLTPVAAGTVSYTFRFSLDGGTTWRYVDSDGSGNDAVFSAAKLGTLIVTTAGTGPVICGLSPAFGTVLGGTTVTVTGSGFESPTRAQTKVYVDSVPVPSVTVTSSTTLTFTTPTHSIGAVDVKIESLDSESDTLTDGFTFVPKLGAGSLTINGEFGLAEWDDGFKVATNTLPADCVGCWGSSNVLSNLYLAYDANNLYVGIEGKCEMGNGIVLFLDRDFGASPVTGVSNMSTLTDVSGGSGNDIDITISSDLNVTTSGFGAEVAFGARGYSADPAQTSLGWRGLADADDFAWLTTDAVIALGSGAVETSIPLTQIWPSGLPAQGTTIAVFARIVSGDGTATSNQSLPEGYDGTNDTTKWNVANLAVLPIR